nr:MAG TPA: Myc proto-oncogene protein zipper, transcription factor, tumor [Caudoviricetes sp.]
MEAAIKRIHELEKSNRNWRRKVQRLRKELKEVKHEG